MACSGAYATSWQYAAFWCMASLLTGEHEGAGPADAALVDSTVSFLNAGAEAGAGQMLYNVTQNTSGPIVAVTDTTLQATGVTWNAGDVYRSAFMSTAEQSKIDLYLSITAGDIHAALGAVGACDCDLSDWGANELAKINIILARVFYDCPCTPTLTDADKQLYSQLANNLLDKIYSGELDVCSGATGSKYPVIGWAEFNTNPFAAAEIIARDIERTRG